MVQSRVTSKGQITIPKSVREAMGIKPGDEIEIEETPQGFLLRKHVKESPFDKYTGYLSSKTDTDPDELVKNLRGHS